MQSDERPSFTLYRMAFTDEAGRARSTVGIIGALPGSPEGAEPAAGHGVSRTNGPHPRPRPTGSSSPARTPANLSPIWGLSLAPGLTGLVTERGRPAGIDGRRRRRVPTRSSSSTTPRASAAISAAVAGHAVLIADGHHRYGVSQQYREERRAANGGRPGPYDLTWPTWGSWSRSSSAWHHPPPARRPAGRAGLARDPTPWFDTEPAGPATSELAASLVELDACLRRGRRHRHPAAAEGRRFDGVRDLDSVRLEHAMADVPQSLRYEPRLASVVAALAAGAAQAAGLVRP